MSYLPVPFPRWQYHRTLEARVVANMDELEALGDGWADHPNLLTEPEPAAAVVESAKTPTTKRKRT